MIRVLKPDGRLVCAEPDWSKFVIVGDGDQDTTNIIQREWVCGIRNPDIAKKLQPELVNQGVIDVVEERFDVAFKGFKSINTVYDIVKVVEALIEKHPAEKAKLSRWLDNLRQSVSPEASTSSVICLTGGRKPPLLTYG